LSAALAVPASAQPKGAHPNDTKALLGMVPRPRPALAGDKPAPPPEPAMDLSKAVPAKNLSRMPSSAQQLGSLKAELAKDQPAVASAKQQSDSLADQARALRQKLIDTAARIEALENDKIKLDADIAALEGEDAKLTESFARDRISVTKLLAILERLQHDMPPALAVRPDDALAAARGAMLIGDTLPPVYARAADLARRIDQLKATRSALLVRRSESVRNQTALTEARGQLETLSAEKDRQAASAADLYSDLKTQLDAVAAQAADFQALVTRVAALRRSGTGDGADIVTVTAASSGASGPLAKGSLLPPVAGTLVPGEGDSAKNPGLSFATLPGAQVIAPADGKVLFAGPYHKNGQVLILEITTGYDLVLAGLGRVSVRPDDELLAGEPIGTMPQNGVENAGEHLYFELRQNGHGLDPAPWMNLTSRKAKRS
jgi:septal ring factor EnvC (AmiA/AmiB activator)